MYFFLKFNSVQLKVQCKKKSGFVSLLLNVKSEISVDQMFLNVHTSKWNLNGVFYVT